MAGDDKTASGSSFASTHNTATSRAAPLKLKKARDGDWVGTMVHDVHDGNEIITIYSETGPRCRSKAQEIVRSLEQDPSQLPSDFTRLPLWCNDHTENMSKLGEFHSTIDGYKWHPTEGN